MILFIKTKSNLNSIEIIADNEKKILTRNGEIQNVNVDNFVDLVTNIVWHWPEHLEGQEGVLKQSYEIKVFDKDKLQRKYTGINAFPDNYHELLKVIESSYGRSK